MRCALPLLLLLLFPFEAEASCRDLQREKSKIIAKMMWNYEMHAEGYISREWLRGNINRLRNRHNRLVYALRKCKPR